MDTSYIARLGIVVLKAFLPVFILAMVIGLITIGVMAIFQRRSFRANSIPLVFAFGFLGTTAGMIAGISREAVVSALLTGLLGVISALLSYLFSKESLREWRGVIPFAMIYLMLGALGGLSVGGAYKAEWEDYERKYKIYLMQQENYEALLKEGRLKEFGLGIYFDKKETHADKK